MWSLCVLPAFCRVEQDLEDIERKKQSLGRYLRTLLAVQARGPEFNPQTFHEDPGEAAHVCNPSASKPEL